MVPASSTKNVVVGDIGSQRSKSTAYRGYPPSLQLSPWVLALMVQGGVIPPRRDYSAALVLVCPDKHVEAIMLRTAGQGKVRLTLRF